MNDPTITSAIGPDGNFGTIPYYLPLDGEPANYDGQTDVPITETEGDYLSFVVFGRTKGFKARDFTMDLSSGDPMGQIVRGVAGYWQKQAQRRLIGVLNGVFGIQGDDDWAKHTVNLAAPDEAAGETAVTFDETTLNDVATETLGDNKHLYSLVVMHSNVARRLENLQLLEFWKGTDANGIQRPMNLASCNGYTVIVDDGVPVTKGTNNDLPQYTTYLLGNGAMRTAKAALAHPVGTQRDEVKNGGEEVLVTRIREVLHPNGFSYVLPTTGFTQSPTDEQLFGSDRYVRKYVSKAIPMAKIVTN